MYLILRIKVPTNIEKIDFSVATVTSISQQQQQKSTICLCKAIDHHKPLTSEGPPMRKRLTPVNTPLSASQPINRLK